MDGFTRKAEIQMLMPKLPLLKGWSLIQLFYNIMWGKQNVSLGLNWPLCTRWSEEMADWSLLTAPSQENGGWQWGGGVFLVREDQLEEIAWGLLGRGTSPVPVATYLLQVLVP